MKKNLWPFIITALIGIPFLFIDKVSISWFINRNHHVVFDFLFKYGTFLGDGIMIAFVFIGLLSQKRKFIFAFFIAFLVHLVCVHIFKQWLCNGMWRPSVLFENEFPDRILHFVEGVKVRRYNTFPSGHTTTAFYLSSFLAVFLNNWKWSYPLLMLAIIAGFSRIYLMQHFYPDVFAGICFGLLSTFLGFKAIARPKQWHEKSFFKGKYLIR